MNMGTQMTRSEKNKMVYDYLKQYDVYQSQSGRTLGYNIAAIVQYAKEKGCELTDLTQEEVELFAV